LGMDAGPEQSNPARRGLPSPPGDIIDGMRRWLSLALLVAAVAAASSGTAAEAPAPVTAVTLDNGLRVLLLEDHRSPIVSLQLWYRVGSRNEARGATGIAHF